MNQRGTSNPSQASSTGQSHADSAWSRDAQQTLERMRTLANWMDSAFVVPVIRRRIGIDSLIGLIPIVGDVATTAASAVIVRHAVRLGMRKRTVLRMLANIALDLLIGLIPFAGDLFDMVFKANTKNVDLMESEIDGGRVIMSIETSDKPI